MWVVSVDGFVSIARPRDHGGDGLVVRARDRQSLVRFCKRIGADPDARIVRGGGSDYGWRLRATRDEVADVLLGAVRRIDYANVKDAVSRSRGRRYHDAMLDAWVALRSLEAPRGRRRGRVSGPTREAW